MFYLQMRELVTCMGIFAHYFENKERYPAWLSALNYKAQFWAKRSQSFAKIVLHYMSRLIVAKCVGKGCLTCTCTFLYTCTQYTTECQRGVVAGLLIFAKTCQITHRLRYLMVVDHRLILTKLCEYDTEVSDVVFSFFCIKSTFRHCDPIIIFTYKVTLWTKTKNARKSHVRVHRSIFVSSVAKHPRS